MRLLFLLFLVSCATTSEKSLFLGRPPVELSMADIRQLEFEAKKYWKKRHDRISLVKSLALFEKLAEGTEDHYQYLVYLSRGYYFLADAHYQDLRTKRKYWQIGVSYGEQALQTNPDFALAMRRGEKFEDSVYLLGRKEIAAMYWTATNTGIWAKRTGIATSLRFQERVKALMQRVEEIDPRFFHGAIDRWWGGYYAALPKFSEGDLRKAREHFLRSISQAPYYLGTRLIYASFYACKSKDRELFKSLLNEVVKAPVNHPEVGPENIIDQAKAKRLLAGMEIAFQKC